MKAAAEPTLTTYWLDQITWSAEGLVPVVAQDHNTGRVLMQAWVNREALSLSVTERRAIYWSRSRNRLWRKGEESGHVQQLHDILLDCDGDALIYVVDQVGGMACHTGRASCFYRRLDNNGEWQVTDPVLKDPHAIYGGSDRHHG
jgi:phosphoribosyl-AMP cyclohydrolase